MAEENNKNTSNGDIFEINTGAFELKVYWNKGVVSSQIAVLVGAGALWICSKDGAIHSLCIVAIAVDLIAILFYLVSTFGKNKESAESGNTAPPPATDTVDTNVQHVKNKRSSVSNSNKTIKTKVPVPNPNAERKHGASTSVSTPEPEPVVETPVPEPTPIPTPAPAPAPTPSAQNTVMTDMGDDDWDGFF